MANSIDQLKAEVGKAGGFAQRNLYMVQLPRDVAGIELMPGLSNRTMNTLCTAATMPGRTLQTHERRVNMDSRQIAYGYTKDDVTLTFKVLNDSKMRRYWEKWLEVILGNTHPYQLKYHNTYAKTIKIAQLKRGVSLVAKKKNINMPSILNKIPPELRNRVGDIDLNLGGLGVEFDPFNGTIGVNFGARDSASYICHLLEAYPISISPIEYGDDQNEFVTFTVTLTYKDWGSQLPGTNANEGMFASFFQSGLSKILN